MVNIGRNYFVIMYTKFMKKLLSIIFCLLSFSSLTNASTKIEEVFSDIDKNYVYYNELQVLYDKGMFTPDEN
ncbi:MAG: hypothetical protein LBC61_04935 [Candidatus Peribacteria bacterium]|nr:hypothetical protein [Candidatus Peribacteria bacterium]